MKQDSSVFFSSAIEVVLKIGELLIHSLEIF